MESFDLKIAGIDAVLYVDGATLRIEEDGRVLVDTDHVLSAGIMGAERLVVSWESDGRRQMITVRVVSAPAAHACSAITSALRK